MENIKNDIINYIISNHYDDFPEYFSNKEMHEKLLINLTNNRELLEFIYDLIFNKKIITNISLDYTYRYENYKLFKDKYNFDFVLCIDKIKLNKKDCYNFIKYILFGIVESGTDFILKELNCNFLTNITNTISVYEFKFILKEIYIEIKNNNLNLNDYLYFVCDMITNDIFEYEKMAYIKIIFNTIFNFIIYKKDSNIVYKKFYWEFIYMFEKNKIARNIIKEFIIKNFGFHAFLNFYKDTL